MKNRVLGIAATALASLAAAVGLTVAPTVPDNRALRRGQSAKHAASFFGSSDRTVAQDKRDATKKRNRRRNKR